MEFPIPDIVRELQFKKKRIRALYDAGWAEGTVTWLNTIIGLRVEYEDDSEDYIKESEINGVDIFFPL